MKKVPKFLWACAKVLYYPIYVLACLLHVLVRFMLAITYALMLDFKKAKDIIKYLFVRYGKY